MERFICDDDDDDYTINRIYTDEDGDLCLESTDAVDDLDDYTCDGILERLEEYSDDMYVYFREEYEDESANCYYIEDEWYIGTNEEDAPILNNVSST